MRLVIAVSLLLFLFCVVSPSLSSASVTTESHTGGVRKNDETVARLLQELKEEGHQTPPEPPKHLGVHAACLKHGLGCPDSYVDFLMKQKKEGKTSQEDNKINEPIRKIPSSGTYSNAANVRRNAPNSNKDATDEVHLENIRRVRNVMNDRLKEHQSPEKQWHCQQVRWFHRGLNTALTLHNVLVDRYWNFIIYSFFPCVLLTTVLTWIFFGDRMPREHLLSLLADDPNVALTAERARRKPPHSVAELVIQRESYNNSSYVDADEEDDVNGDVEGAELLPMANLNELVRLQKEARKSDIQHRVDRWNVARFALLEAHSESTAAVTVLKLRLVLSLLVFFTLVWTLFALPLRVADLHSSNGGIFQFLFASICPSWMTTSIALYFAWSWMGSMVAFAGWEVVSAGEAILKSDAHAAALHEKILQHWCS
ncbi:uncharacterized protein TM35_000092360 [Trypanosoma theileri]|uniref:Uncharacterized protein n=1 Tax=Trypanosoma theileri TaxID=67003 RepID=A0A1X0NZR7_9TRYP|nr:uncharacterized protein TM35_000092360 [Trypanosoma theileri]ORC90186.1 hypothetical protein TM35_000092360 [Trypanosoma theileri]